MTDLADGTPDPVPHDSGDEARPARASKRWPRWARPLLENLRETRSVQAACEAVGKERSTAYRLRHRDPEFAKAWDEVMVVHREKLEASAMELATEGSKEPVFQKGRLIGFVRKRYPGLLMFLLRAHLPERHAAKQGENSQWTPAEYARAALDLLAQMEATVPSKARPDTPPTTPAADSGGS